jgi:AraC-like DNA-binding protein
MSLVVIAPPWMRAVPLSSSLLLRPELLEPGSVIGMALTVCAAADARLPGRLRWLRQGFPGTPLLGMAPSKAVLAARRASLAAAGLVRVFAGEPTAEKLRATIDPSPDVVLDGMMNWLAAVRPDQSAALLDDLRACLSEEPVREARLRRDLKEAGLPLPVWWTKLLRAAQAVAALQTEPRLSMTAAALGSGYYDQPAMANALRECFGTTPSEVRGRLGVEEFLAVALGAAPANHLALSGI